MGIEKRDSRSFSSFIYNNNNLYYNICHLELYETDIDKNYIELNNKLYCKKCFRNLRFV